MVDPNKVELAAMANAAKCAGEYIESLGRTDMATWDNAEWSKFIGVTCGGYVDGMMNEQAAANAAAAKIRAG